VVRPMSPGEWRTHYELAKEAVPAEVQAFNPLSEREFRVGPWMRLLQTFSHFLERVEVHIWAAEALLTKALGSLKNYPGRGVLARVWSSRTALLDLYDANSNPLAPPYNLNAPDSSRSRTWEQTEAIFRAYEELVACAAKKSVRGDQRGHRHAGKISKRRRKSEKDSCVFHPSERAAGCLPTGRPPSVVTPTPPAARPSPARGYCGDGRCDGPENPQNCPADCAAPSPTMVRPLATRTPAAATPTPSRGQAVLYLGIMVHLRAGTTPATGRNLSGMSNWCASMPRCLRSMAPS
jgi:hypothetical protein